jgi:hypothetical protein
MQWQNEEKSCSEKTQSNVCQIFFVINIIFKDKRVNFNFKTNIFLWIRKVEISIIWQRKLSELLWLYFYLVAKGGQ